VQSPNQKVTTSAPMSRRIARWYGQFKATGSADPEVLYARMKEMKAKYWQAKLGGWIMVGVGISAILLVMGFFLVPIGAGILLSAYRKTWAIDAAYRQYCEDMGITAL
jgi:hypothetical protein